MKLILPSSSVLLALFLACSHVFPYVVSFSFPFLHLSLANYFSFYFFFIPFCLSFSPFIPPCYWLPLYFSSPFLSFLIAPALLLVFSVHSFACLFLSCRLIPPFVFQYLRLFSLFSCLYLIIFVVSPVLVRKLCLLFSLLAAFMLAARSSRLFSSVFSSLLTFLILSYFSTFPSFLHMMSIVHFIVSYFLCKFSFSGFYSSFFCFLVPSFHFP